MIESWQSPVELVCPVVEKMLQFPQMIMSPSSSSSSSLGHHLLFLLLLFHPLVFIKNPLLVLLRSHHRLSPSNFIKCFSSCSYTYLASFTDLLTVGSSRVTWSLITQLPCRQPALIWSPYFPHFFWKLHMVRRLFEILVPCVLIETRLQSFQQHPICIAQSFLAYYWVSGSFYLPLIYSIYGRWTTLIEKQRRSCWNKKQ